MDTRTYGGLYYDPSIVSGGRSISQGDERGKKDEVPVARNMCPAPNVMVVFAVERMELAIR